MIKYSLNLPEKQIEKLKELGQVSVSEHIRRSISNYLKEIEQSRVSVSLSKKENMNEQVNPISDNTIEENREMAKAGMDAYDGIKNPQTMSPIIEDAEVVPTRGEMTFPQAVEAMTNGKVVTKLEWESENDFCLLKGEKLQIHTRGSFHDWIISLGDLTGTDWVILK